MKNFTLTILISLAFFVVPQAAYSQKDGEAQAVVLDLKNRVSLKFTNKKADKQRCAFLVGNSVMMNGEEAFVLKVTHLYQNFNINDSPSEYGWLYITPSRIIFTVEAGDKSLSFDVPREDLKNNRVATLPRGFPVGIQINLKDRPDGPGGGEQKFAFLLSGDKDCEKELAFPNAYIKFIKRTINDFDRAQAEFKKLTNSLWLAGAKY